MIPEAEDRFAGIAWRTVATGSPILPDVLGWLDCRLSHSYDGDDHSIFVGEVLAAGNREDAAPLLYFNRHWRQLDGEAADAFLTGDALACLCAQSFTVLHYMTAAS